MEQFKEITKICKKYGISLEEFLVLYTISGNTILGDIINSLKINGYIVPEFRSYKLTDLGTQLLHNIKRVKTTHEISEEDLDIFVLKLQELFPKERKTDSSGIPKYSFKGNKVDVKTRLKKFLKLYKKDITSGEVEDYTLDEIYEATKRYVNRFSIDKTYMMLLPYFILKDNESTLATELENICEASVDEVGFSSNLSLL